MNIQYFIEARHRAGLTQNELSKGICTQATLSKFENLGKAPSLKILARLCARLNITLDDIFPVSSQSANSTQEQLLNSAEFTLITSEYQDAQKQLDQINIDQLTTDGKMQYYFIKGFIQVLTGHSIAEVVYYFDQIINGLDEQHESVFSQLAYTGIGLAYSKQHEIDKGNFYFQKVFAQLHQLSLTNEKAVWRVLTIVFYTSEYFAEIQDFETSDSLLNYGYDICADNHVTYYVARIRFRQAQNAKATHHSTKEINELLNEAKAFAKINRNAVLLNHIDSFNI